ncbi:hypothetical protein NDU88_004386 [Pleurodeles waltl]|uniref:Uncharacterized protein n=1 Tax=Pleurodeles waltl TaxID=8319 RepID=A0AAV7VGX9_PLEWA|nr:hypothetical protein NDU88_004386 [Pleurodeles waltl]
MREGVIVVVTLRVCVCRHFGIQSRGAAGKTVRVGRVTSTAISGWFDMAPKMSKLAKAPRYSWGKPGTGPGMNMRDLKQPPLSQMARISVHRMGGQSGLVVEKEPPQMQRPWQDVGCKDNAVDEVGSLISYMFKHLMRTRCLAPLLPGN